MTEYIYGTDEQQVHWLTNEEIVRCRDCKHYDDQDGEIGTCDLGLDNLDLYSIVEPDGFCAWGERRDA